MRLTRRGKAVCAILTLVVIAAFYQIITHLWWVGDGYCWGEMVQCYWGDK